MTKVAIVKYPGSNCETDLEQGLIDHFSLKPQVYSYREKIIGSCDIIFIPGGFSYGDYLRSGAIAARSSISEAIRKKAKAGVCIVGICNGFQILTEMGLLPGTLLKNQNGEFISKKSELKCSGIFSHLGEAEYISAHGEGRFYIENEKHQRLLDKDQILFRYKDNFNGSTDAIAGISDESKRIMGLMPHPERALYSELSGPDSIDGQKFFATLLDNF